MKKNKKKKLVAAACLALLAAAAGTFAWINSQDQNINRVKTAAIKDGSVTIQEKWDPKPIIPGTEAKKEVSVTNSGSTPVFVRVSYEEVLQHLTEKGEVTSRETGWKLKEKPVLTDDIPVEYDGEKYIKDDGYKDVTANVKDISDKSLPEGVKVYAQGSVIKDDLTGTESTTFNYSAFFEYEKDKYQTMETELTVKDGNSKDSNISDWTFKMSKANYLVYDKGYTNKAINWAASSLEGASKEATDIKAALLGSKGKKYDKEYDYTSAGLGINKLPEPTPTVKSEQIPVKNAEKKGVQADLAALDVSGIKIEYGDDMVTIDALEGNKWAYNKEDGYFYYTSPVASGNVTKDLLKKLIFTNEIGKEYTNATYDLIVKMEAIQATKEALTDSAGWNLNGEADSETKKITSYLDTQVLS